MLWLSGKLIHQEKDNRGAYINLIASLVIHSDGHYEKNFINPPSKKKIVSAEELHSFTHGQAQAGHDGPIYPFPMDKVFAV